MRSAPHACRNDGPSFEDSCSRQSTNMLRTIAIVLVDEGRYGAEMRANHSLQGKLQFAAAGSFTADAQAGHGEFCKGC